MSPLPTRLALSTLPALFKILIHGLLGIFFPNRRAELFHPQAIDFNRTRWLGNTDDGDIYFPFGYGLRQCPGKPFAQVQMIAFLARLPKEYTLQLIVDDEMLSSCRGDKEMAWQRTQDNAIHQMKDDLEFSINIQMLKELSIRVVRRNSGAKRVSRGSTCISVEHLQRAEFLDAVAGEVKYLK